MHTAQVDLPTDLGVPVAATLMAEEPGLMLEVRAEDSEAVCAAYVAAGVPCEVIGATVDVPTVKVCVGGEVVLEGPTAEWWDVWEETSFALERLQAAPEAVAAEQQGLRFRTPPRWRLSFVPEWDDVVRAGAPARPKVAILREEGSNGDREMAAAVYAAGAPPVATQLVRLVRPRPHTLPCSLHALQAWSRGT
jgi:phosphoribosylformylglycinamidine synthase